ncbi:MAG: DUF4129 domain-containing protein [Prevotella sp.]|nr:DUF4129 domain-containing protein [Prevotella sp.]
MDTLQLDSAQLAVFQNDSRFDYDRELVGGSQNLLEWLTTVISEWLEETFNVLVDNDVVYYSLIGLGALLVLFLSWLVWKKNPKLFMRKEEEPLDYDVQEDTIYGVDFEAGISEALSQKDYRQAVRLLYLQTLKQLSDAGHIDWQPSKTPSQYVREYGHKAFAELSQHFILVRYGNFEATEALFQEMRELQGQSIVKSSEDNAAQPTMNDMHYKKGGEP